MSLGFAYIFTLILFLCVKNTLLITFQMMDVSRIASFHLFLLNIAAAIVVNFQHHWASSIQKERTQISHYPVPRQFVFSFTSDKIDRIAQRINPVDASHNFVPIQTTGNGNCLYNAIIVYYCVGLKLWRMNLG
jgi:hypothetical protein